MAKSFFDKTNAEVLVDGFPAFGALVQLGYEVRIAAKRLPDTENRKGVFRYTARIYKGRKHVATTQDTNIFHLVGVMIPAEFETLENS